MTGQHWIQATFLTTLCVGLAVASASAAAGDGSTTAVRCGDTLMAPGHYVLENDLICGAPAVIVAGNGIRLDLRGHSITNASPISDGFEAGILVPGSKSHIVNGTVSGFTMGVWITGDWNQVSRITASRNAAGIFLCCDATHNRIQRNTVSDNLSTGALVGTGIADYDGARHNIIRRNTVSGNDYWGIALSDGPDQPAKLGKVLDNQVNDNGDVGIILFRTGVTRSIVRGNEVIGNGNWGVLTAGDAVEGFPSGNLIHRNRVLNNGSADLIESSPICTNAWKNNTYSTIGEADAGANPDCITNPIRWKQASGSADGS